MLGTSEVVRRRAADNLSGAHGEQCRHNGETEYRKLDPTKGSWKTESKTCIEKYPEKHTTDLQSFFNPAGPFCRTCSKLSGSSRKVKVL